MPTLVTCVAACLVLVTAVGLQAPAVSVGLRWTPEPPNRVELPGDKIVGDLQFDWSLRPTDGLPAWIYWSLAGLVVLLMLIAAARWISHLRRRAPTMNVARVGADSRTPSEEDARIVQSGLAAAIDILSSEGERDPGNAIVRAWQGLQDAAATGGVHRRPAETATEFTARILYRSRASAAPIAVMLELYQRVRFGEHTPTAAEIATARQSLAILVELWRADFPERRAARAAR